MGRVGNTELSYGTSGSPQETIEQSEYEFKEKQLEITVSNEKAFKEYERMIQPLVDAGVKFNRDEVVFVSKDKTGQLVWLEKGNKYAGLEHILNGNGEKSGHAEDFVKAFGIKKEDIPQYLSKVIENGEIISQTVKNNGFQKIYYYEGNHYVVTGIGKNGYIVTAYPKKKGG